MLSYFRKVNVSVCFHEIMVLYFTVMLFTLFSCQLTNSNNTNFCFVSVLSPKVIGIAIARYDFCARDMRELSLLKGDVVKIYTKMSANGWWRGEVNGRVCCFCLICLICVAFTVGDFVKRCVPILLHLVYLRDKKRFACSHLLHSSQAALLPASFPSIYINWLFNVTCQAEYLDKIIWLENNQD